MNISTLLLLLLSFTTMYSTRADQVLLLDTRTATTELNWKTWSNQEERDGWLEETTYSEEQKVNHRIFSICDVGHTDIENWLLVPAVDLRGEASRLQMEIGYNIAKCEKLLVLSKRQLAACRETMKLYGMMLSDGKQLSQNWFNDSKWEYLDTLVIKSEKENDTRQILTVSYPIESSITSSRIHFALKNTGACVAILYIKLYYNFCPESFHSFTHLPRTIPAVDVNSVVTITGRCVHNASPSFESAANLLTRSEIVAQPPTFICKADGTWQSVGKSRCECSPGYIPSLKTNLCTACGVGTYKAVHGSGECTQCPEHSTSYRPGSAICECDVGYARLSNETTAQPCKQKQSLFEKHTELVVVEERSGVGSTSARIYEGNHNDLFENTSKTANWLDDIFSIQQFWLWLVICIVSTLILCCVLFTISRHSVFNRKQLSDMDALDSYKRDIVSPDYNRLCNGQLSTLSGIASNKSNLPLISAYGTTQRNRSTPGMSMMNNDRFKFYVDPTTYEDPRKALDEFTNEISDKCINVTRVIGAGEFGEVCSGRLITEDAYGQRHEHVVAIKTLIAGSSPKAKSDFLMEALIMGQFEHENVIRLLGVVTKTEPVMILTEYMINGSLDQFLKINDEKIETYQLIQLLHGIACGMKYLNDKGYVHRDLAARNVLVDDRLVCKIADFGLSRGLTGRFGEQEYTTRYSEKIPIRWTAPEAIAHSKYTTASDVWSYGVVMWEVFSFGDRPYGNWTNHKVIDEVKLGYRLPSPLKTPSEIYELMRHCWAMERHERPNFGEIVQALNIYLTNKFYFQQDTSPMCFIQTPYKNEIIS